MRAHAAAVATVAALAMPAVARAELLGPVPDSARPLARTAGGVLFAARGRPAEELWIAGDRGAARKFVPAVQAGRIDASATHVATMDSADGGFVLRAGPLGGPLREVARCSAFTVGVGFELRGSRLAHTLAGCDRGARRLAVVDLAASAGSPVIAALPFGPAGTPLLSDDRVLVPSLAGGAALLLDARTGATVTTIRPRKPINLWALGAGDMVAGCAHTAVYAGTPDRLVQRARLRCSGTPLVSPGGEVLVISAAAGGVEELSVISGGRRRLLARRPATTFGPGAMVDGSMLIATIPSCVRAARLLVTPINGAAPVSTRTSGDCSLRPVGGLARARGSTSVTARVRCSGGCVGRVRLDAVTSAPCGVRSTPLGPFRPVTVRAGETATLTLQLTAAAHARMARSSGVTARLEFVRREGVFRGQTVSSTTRPLRGDRSGPMPAPPRPGGKPCLLPADPLG